MQWKRWFQIRLSWIFLLTVAAAVGSLWLSYRQRTEQLPVMLDGFCAVTLLEKDVWKKGLPEHSAMYEGRRHLFAGKNEAEDFLADPARYSPQAGGLDVVVLQDKREAVLGERGHGVVFRKKVYLFESEESLMKFWKSPSSYVATAENWKGVPKASVWRKKSDQKPKPSDLTLR